MQANEKQEEIIIETAVCRHCYRPFQIIKGDDHDGFCSDFHRLADIQARDRYEPKNFKGITRFLNQDVPL